ncbi:hypothetical protein NQZ68_032168 [Dissostichus eleginoides]|nr:hypothetical protein NQZ68_032168 [Dissostichus eleginoides]
MSRAGLSPFSRLSQSEARTSCCCVSSDQLYCFLAGTLDFCWTTENTTEAAQYSLVAPILI